MTNHPTNEQDAGIPALLSEAELAGLARRSAPFVSNARRLGLIRPVGRCARSYVYAPDAIAAVQAITAPVFPRRSLRAAA